MRAEDEERIRAEIKAGLAFLACCYESDRTLVLIGMLGGFLSSSVPPIDYDQTLQGIARDALKFVADAGADGIQLPQRG